MPSKSCLNCGYRSLNTEKCPVIGYPYKDTTQSCPYWVAELPICGLCGQVDPQALFTQKSDGSWIRCCQNCTSKFNTCGTCSKSSACSFETDPSPLPKAVQKQVQQGNMTTITTIKNPERIDITCRKNCECFDHENAVCRREYTYCRNYKEVF